MRIIKEVEQPKGTELWDRYFTVRYNYMQSRTPEQIRQRGMISTGYKHLDEQLANQEITTQLSIDGMFELHRSRNITIKLVDYNDAATIYQIVHNHILKWVSYLQFAVNFDPDVIKDLIELDKFAALLYPYAENVFTERDRTAIRSGIFSGLDCFSFIAGAENASNSIFFADKEKPSPARTKEYSSFEKALAEFGDRHNVWRFNNGE